ncbi:MAG: NUDIX domain-containing protein [Sphaerochaetaceae bacterium]|nr:NUDIX domain-containing protein [Sphaerochaetaceae bacterium]
MDITFRTVEGRFNYRVAAIIVDDGRLLVMKDERSPYYYLPGGRVKMQEVARDAVLRELQEELGITATIVRPLWFNQSFFIEDVNKEQYHEICMYYLVDISKTDIQNRGDCFSCMESRTNERQVFSWMPIEDVPQAYLYPEFIKERILRTLPDTLECTVEHR